MEIYLLIHCPLGFITCTVEETETAAPAAPGSTKEPTPQTPATSSTPKPPVPTAVGPPYHQSPHSLLLDTLCLLLLFPFRVGVPRRHGFGQLLDLASHGAVVFLKVFRMLQNAVQVFLQDPEMGRKGHLASTW